MKKISLTMTTLMSISLSIGGEVALATEEKNLEEKIIIDVTDFGADPSGKKDSTVAIQRALEEAKEYEIPVEIDFPKGEYQIYKDKAAKREYHTSNTNSIENPIKTIGILVEDQKDLTIDGNGSLFNMHGNMMALAVVNSENVILENFSWDFEVPTTSEMTVVNIGEENGENYVDYYIPSNFRYEIVDNNTNILWTSEESPYTGEHYWSQKGHHNAWSVVIYNPKEEVVRRHPLGEGPFNGVNNIKEIEENKVRITYNGQVPSGQKIGVVNELCASSMRETAGAFIWQSKDTVVRNVDVHYMHGFGWLTQMSENVTYDTVDFMPREGTGKYTTSFADLIHVSGASGKIRIENSNFSHAHDDPINIHGTFTRVEEKIDNRTLKLKYIHHQQGGFPQYYVGDEVTFFTRDTLMSPNDEETMYRVEEVSHPGEDGNDLRTMIVKFDKDLPEDIDESISGQPKYVAENVTYTPELEIINNKFHTIPTRGILSTTRKPVLIEGNEFKNMGMATIFLSNDSGDWYESGPIRDLTIRNNKFYIKDGGQTEWRFKSAVYIHPVTMGGGLPSAETPIHKNITIEDNEFYMDHDSVVKAESVENLTIRNNKIFRMDPEIELNLSLDKTNLNVNEEVSLNLDKSGSLNEGSEENAFYFDACKNVVVEGNTYDDGLMKNAVVTNMPLEYVKNSDDITINGEEIASEAVGKVSYVSLNPEIARVSEDGKVIGVSAGEAEIVAYYNWNDSAIESNKIKVTVSGEETLKPENIEIVNEENLVIRTLEENVQFEANILPESLNNEVKWSVRNFDGSETDKAIISDEGVLTSKKNGVVIVKAEVNGVSNSKTVIISSEEGTFKPSYIDIVNENKERWNVLDDGETLNLTMDRGDLYQNQNDVKNLVLYDIPEELNKEDLRFTVKVNNLPQKENGRWDTASVLLYKDSNNYISVGKKSHFGGVVTVREENGNATENDKGVQVSGSELIFDIHKEGNTLNIRYKTPDGDYSEWGTLDGAFLGSDYKIGFAVWNHDGRAKEVDFSDFKVGDGSEYTEETIGSLTPIKFMKVGNKKPVASLVTLNKDEVSVGESIEVSYDFLDGENHLEGESVYKWEVAHEGTIYTDYTNTNIYTPNRLGELTCTVYPVDEYGVVGDAVTSETVVISGEERSGVLDTIEVNGIKIEGFKNDVLSYSYNSIKDQDFLILSGSTLNRDDKINVKVANDKVIYEGVGSFEEKIDVTGEDVVSIEVKNSLTDEVKTYTINISKFHDSYDKLDSISIEELRFNISEDINSFYNFEVSREVDKITLELNGDERLGDIKVYKGEWREEVKDNNTSNNVFSGEIKLTAGNNTIFVESIAKDGVNKKRYIINISHLSYIDASLSDLKVNRESLEGFDENIFDYTLRVGKDESKVINVEAMKNDERAEVKVALNNEIIEEYSNGIELNSGYNEIVVSCKAGDLWTTNYYTIRALVEADDNAELLNIESEGNRINPVFQPNVTDYEIKTTKQELNLVVEAQELKANVEVDVNGRKTKGENKVTVNEMLPAGENSASIKVTSPDGNVEKVYNIKVIAENFAYLSDLSWESSSYVGYGDFSRDKSPNGGVIRLLRDGVATSFEKGIGAHAQSELVFDIEGKGYERLQTFAGVDYSQFNSQYGQVTFQIFLDGEEAFNSGEIGPKSEAAFIDLDLTGVKEVRLKALSGINDFNDHAVWADAKFITEFEEVLPPVTSNGDLNEDGVIDVGDLALASKYYGENKPEYDMDGDGIVGDYEIETISEKILE